MPVSTLLFTIGGLYKAVRPRSARGFPLRLEISILPRPGSFRALALLSAATVPLLAMICTWLAPQAGLWTRAGMAQGEYWRLWSAHLTHLNSRHLLLNLLGWLWLTQTLRNAYGQLEAQQVVERHAWGWRYVLGLACAPPCLCALLAGLQPGLQWYGGLSGLLYFWAAWGLLELGWRWPESTIRRWLLTATAGLAVWMSWVLWRSSSVALHLEAALLSGVPSVAAAHGTGWLLGSGAALICLIKPAATRSAHPLHHPQRPR